MFPDSRREIISGRKHVETFKPSLRQFHAAGSSSNFRFHCFSLLIHISDWMSLLSLVKHSLCTAQKYKLKRFTVLDCICSLIFRQQSCTHIAFHQWINSRWNEEFQFIIVRQHSPVHHVTTYKHVLNGLQPVVT